MIALTAPPATPTVVPGEFPADDRLTSVVSASRLNTFHSCRLKFYFRYVMEMVKPATAALFVGKAVHAALQQWSTARWRGQAHDAPALREGFLMSWITGQEDEPVAWEPGEEDAQQELNSERIRRAQAEQKARENEKRKDAWQTAATAALTGAVLLLVVGAGLGSMSKRDAGR
jgi:putative RecB family exonuclease